MENYSIVLPLFNPVVPEVCIMNAASASVFTAVGLAEKKKDDTNQIFNKFYWLIC